VSRRAQLVTRAALRINENGRRERERERTASSQSHYSTLFLIVRQYGGKWIGVRLYACKTRW